MGWFARLFQNKADKQEGYPSEENGASSEKANVASLENAFFSLSIGSVNFGRNSHRGSVVQINRGAGSIQIGNMSGDYSGPSSNKGIKGSGKLATLDVACQPFYSINVSGCVNVVYRWSDALGCSIEGDDNLVERVELKFDGKRVNIGMLPGKYRLKLPLRVTILGPNLQSVEVAGSSDALLEGVKQDTLRIVVSGAGEVQATGEVNNLKINISGSGEVDASEIKAKNVSADISGAGNLECHASQACDIAVSGVGTAVVYGNPTQRASSVSGVGKVKFRA